MMQAELEAYRNYLGRLPISVHTRRNYFLRVSQYLTWLAGSSDSDQDLANAFVRDLSVQQYKTGLLQAGRSAHTVNAVLAAIDNFYMFKGLGASKVKRQDIPAQAPKALEPEDHRRLLRTIAQCNSLRNRAIALIMLNCGLRISEVWGLNIADVVLSARKHELIVRCGKNSKRRTVPVNSDLAAVMREYLASVGNMGAERPLFESQKNNRLSIQAIDHIIRGFARNAAIEFSSHSLRHTCLTRLVRAGVDIVTVAEIAGHSRLETSRRYSLPSESVKIAAMENLNARQA
jgi:site-specific recombinase XerD